MADTSELAELIVGMTISTGGMVARLVNNLRDAKVITAGQARDIIFDLAEQQREMAGQPGVLPGAAAIYASVADTLAATLGRISESSDPSS